MIKSNQKTNREGLTLDEWTRAANHCRRVPLDRHLAFSEWANGVDPTEYAGR